MDNKELDTVELKKVAGGFPSGELSEKFHICPRCGGSSLTLLHEVVVEDSGNPTIDSTLTDKTRRLYNCNECGFRFWRYGNFWETC